MCGVFSEKGVVIDKVYFCPSHPEHGIGRYKIDSLYRKPGSGMIFQAAEEFGIDLSRSVLVEDKETDIQAGIAAGVGCNLLYRASGYDTTIKTAASAVTSSISQVKPFLLINAGTN